jgi:hypothetical protein
MEAWPWCASFACDQRRSCGARFVNPSPAVYWRRFHQIDLPVSDAWVEPSPAIDGPKDPPAMNSRRLTPCVDGRFRPTRHGHERTRPCLPRRSTITHLCSRCWSWEGRPDGFGTARSRMGGLYQALRLAAVQPIPRRTPRRCTARTRATAAANSREAARCRPPPRPVFATRRGARWWWRPNGAASRWALYACTKALDRGPGDAARY